MMFKLTKNNIFQFVLMLWGLTSTLPVAGFAVYLLGALFLFWAVKERPKLKLKSFKSGAVFYLLWIYLLWNVLSLAYTDQFSFGMSRFEKRIPLLLIALVGIFDSPYKKFSIRNVFNAYIWGVVVGMFLIVGHTWYKFLFANYQGMINVYGLAHINYLEVLKHYTYSGADLLMGAAILLYYKAEYSSKISAILHYILVLFIFTVIILSGAKIVILASLFLLAGWIFQVLQRRFSITVVRLILIGFIVLAGVLIVNLPRFTNIIYKIKSDQSFEKVDPRIRSWLSSYSVILDHPLFGVGIGDYDKVLMDQYKKDGFAYGFRNNLNPHNQYLQTTIETGILGLILLLLVFATLLKKNSNKPVAFAFVMVYMTCFLTESMLLRNMGVMSFAFWLFVIGENENGIETSSNEFKNNIQNIILLLAVVLFTVFLIIGSKSSYNFNNPNTYMAIPKSNYTTESITDGELKDMQAAVLSDETELNYDSNMDFIAIPFYRNNRNANTQVDFSVWCFVSSTAEISNLYTYVYNYQETSVRMNYDLNRKGKWQHLIIENCNIKGNFELGIRLDKSINVSSIGGKVKLVKPEFIVKGK